MPLGFSERRIHTGRLDVPAAETAAVEAATAAAMHPFPEVDLAAAGPESEAAVATAETIQTFRFFPSTCRGC